MRLLLHRFVASRSACAEATRPCRDKLSTSSKQLTSAFSIANILREKAPKALAVIIATNRLWYATGSLFPMVRAHVRRPEKRETRNALTCSNRKTVSRVTLLFAIAIYRRRRRRRRFNTTASCHYCHSGRGNFQVYHPKRQLTFSVGPVVLHAEGATSWNIRKGIYRG